MSNYTWPVTMLEEHKVPGNILMFFQGLFDDSEEKSKMLEELHIEHELLKDTSAKQERYIAELEKQLSILQKTLDLVDKNKPRFIVRTKAASSADIVDIFNKEPVILQSEADSIIPIYPYQWIPVTERLPTEEDATDEGCVLVRNKGCPMYEAMDVEQIQVFRDQITHWMSLPEP